tara:strand:+ start:899 stop:1243 length:345 start_codon:yes stop_codon:yes gene_type:complete
MAIKIILYYIIFIVIVIIITRYVNKNNNKMAELVSPCCGAEYTDYEDGPSYCCDATMIAGVCIECKEHAETTEGYICEECKEFFEEPEVIYEYNARRKESITEAQEDERRDLGE